MKQIIVIIVLISCQLFVIAQKRPLRNSDLGTWPVIKDLKISNDGKFLAYTTGDPIAGYKAVISKTDGSWKKEIPAGNYQYFTSNAFFTEDDRRLVFSNKGDSLGILHLANDQLQLWVENVASFKMPLEGNGQWLAYLLRNQSRDLIIRDLFTGTEKIYPKVDKYFFNREGTILVLMTLDTVRNTPAASLKWLDLQKGTAATIGHGYSPYNCVFDESGNQLAFLTEDNNSGETSYKLWHYTQGMDSAKMLSSKQMPAIEGFSVSEGDLSFSKNGNRLFILIRKNDSFPIKDSIITPDVNIWNYKDEYLHHIQASGAPALYAVIHLNEKNRLVQLGKEGDEKYYNALRDINGHNIIVKTKTDGKGNDFKWNTEITRQDLYIISTKDGSRKLLKRNIISSWLSFSPSGKYVIWYDREQKNWFSYNVIDEITKNITVSVPVPLYLEMDYATYSESLGIGSWMENDAAIFIYDRHDIWKIDPDGINKPANTTNGYGQRNNITLRILDAEGKGKMILRAKDTLILSAFNQTDKQSGFYKTIVDKQANPVLLSMGPFAQYGAGGGSLLLRDYHVTPVKAKHANVYIMSRMNATTYPNIHISTDLKKSEALTDLQPQKKFNWYTNEIVRWKLPNGRMEQGILYKPENFDAHKKYPLIFYYYEKNADGLNIYIAPEHSAGCLNIAWYASNGYLVFVPDFNYEIGQPGKSAYETVVSAAEFLSQKGWVDKKKMGLQGHSFGGWETNDIISRTTLFAAAASSAGYGDLISMYSDPRGGSMHHYFETLQGRLGASLWKNKEIYFQNSPLFRADKITTPLLMMHNKNDGAVNWRYGFEWFTALNSLDKKVWMVEYDNESHSIGEQRNRVDYTIRLSQFFDHYLKDAPAPVWMTQGIPRMLKGKTNGFDLDFSGVKP